jgi:hypothetical protein
MLRRIDPNHFAIQLQGNPALLPKALRPQHNALERLLQGEVLLGQGRAFVGQMGLFAQQRQAARKALLAQGDGGLRAAMPGTDDQHVKVLHRRGLIHRGPPRRTGLRCWRPG